MRSAVPRQLLVLVLVLVLGLGSSLVACKDEAPPERERKDRRPKRERVEAPPSPPPSPAPEPELERPQPTAVVEAPPQQWWWCLCYLREVPAPVGEEEDGGADAPATEPMTACRATRDQCRKLEKRVTKGSKEIIAGSLTHACRSITGQHPSDAHGTREQWQPSKLAGAWVSEGVCQFAGAPAAAPEEVPEPEAPTGDPYALLNSELIGELSLGMGTEAVRHKLGQPERRGEIEEMAATGDWEQVWDYPDGLTVLMHSGTRSGPQSVGAVLITAPSQLQTRRGIGIGASRARVERAYADVEAPEEEGGGGDDFVAGSIYGGLIFSFEDEGVARIFLGAAAE